MYFSIRTLTTWTAPILKCPAVGTVHSSYGKAVNLIFDSGMASLQPSCSPVSPLSLITGLNAPAFASLPLKKGQTAEILQKEIRIRTDVGNVSFSFSDAETADTLLIPSVSEDWKQHIGSALAESSAGGFRRLFISDESMLPRDDHFLVTDTARKILSRCDKYWLNGRFVDAASELNRMIGLGIGLTPSGDDFLCGILAGFILSGHQDHLFFRSLRKQIAENLDRTNELSGAFLQCALSSHFSLTVKHLCSCHTAGETASAFSQIGHSSGMDTLSGIYYALSLLQKEPEQQ